jgi:hypothetical protein
MKAARSADGWAALCQARREAGVVVRRRQLIELARQAIWRRNSSLMAA